MGWEIVWPRIDIRLGLDLAELAESAREWFVDRKDNGETFVLRLLALDWAICCGYSSVIAAPIG